MRAWHFQGTGRPLVKALSKPAPIPGAGEVRLTVTAAGLCHTDVGILEDAKFLPLFPRLPVAPGHEIAGVVERVGDGVTEFVVGERVVVWPSANSQVGYKMDGGYQEQVVVPAWSLVRIPAGVSDASAATSACAGMTAHGSMITRARVRPGERVAIIGVGGVGQIAGRLAVLSGAELYAVETNRAAWPVAERIGAVRVVEDVGELIGLDLDVIVDYAGFGTTTAAAIETVRHGGRVVLVGMGRLEATINTYPLMVNEIDLLGNRGGTAADIASVLQWMAQGEIDPDVEQIRWEDIPDGVERLRRGGVRGRLVATS